MAEGSGIVVGEPNGEFEPVASERILTFLSDGTIESAGNLCEFSSDDSGILVNGNYSLVSNKITDLDCSTDLELTFEYTSTTLIVSYSCFEACRAKYVKVQ